MYNEYEEMQKFLDNEADCYVPFEEILEGRDLTFEDALKGAENYHNKFFQLLRENGIDSNNISRICVELSEKIKENPSNDMLFLYTALLTENGLLFGDITDDEQKILLWLDQSEKAKFLAELIKNEPVFRNKVSETVESIKNIKVSVEIDREEQALLYKMALQHNFLYKARNSNIFLENVGELVRQMNSNEYLKAVKPYVYSAVLSRKHKMMTERKNYSSNIANVFELTDYKIDTDNGKNFDTYQSYLELYEQLRRHYYDECDVELSDYCFANLSNLSEWYYANCEPNEDIPMTLKQTVEMLTETIELTSEIDDISNFVDDNPVLEIAYINVLSDEVKWSDFVDAMHNEEDIHEYVERLYNLAEAEKICSDKEKALQFAELCLMQYMEEVNRQVLIDVLNTLIIE